MALHHHLRAPTHAEEVKPFADICNLEQVRSFIAEQEIHVVLHGHKHAGRIHFPTSSNRLSSHRTKY